MDSFTMKESEKILSGEGLPVDLGLPNFWPDEYGEFGTNAGEGFYDEKI
jgi:hypothetical protein